MSDRRMAFLSPDMEGDGSAHRTVNNGQQRSCKIPCRVSAWFSACREVGQEKKRRIFQINLQLRIRGQRSPSLSRFPAFLHFHSSACAPPSPAGQDSHPPKSPHSSQISSFKLSLKDKYSPFHFGAETFSFFPLSQPSFLNGGVLPRTRKTVIYKK